MVVVVVVVLIEDRMPSSRNITSFLFILFSFFYNHAGLGCATRGSSISRGCKGAVALPHIFGSICSVPSRLDRSPKEHAVNGEVLNCRWFRGADDAAAAANAGCVCDYASCLPVECSMPKPFAQVREKANAKLSKTLPAAYSAAVKMATSGEGGRNHKPSDVFADN